MSWSLRASTAADAEWIAELRAEVMRPDLERLGVFDPVRVRQRFLDAFDARVTWIIVIDGADAGSIAARPAADGVWIEHFYLAPATQGRGIGGAVLGRVLGEQSGTVRINVLQGSPARRLYERQGFVLDSEDDVDAYLVRRASVPKAG
ncbi:MAG: GNAT family N-acetyltransferase [Microbacterium sp.]|uniref:GNAT family N-acetyltransferase n=1 Tax=Microbacterium sp. TaxID=51671 RepID=UPI001AD413D3|nr:GNAT family N-acetyltransferase [Microbacterium sp.]MBN9176652.1 GNAT family N-acetyltransferase [Microbacterium sp.]